MEITQVSQEVVSNPIQPVSARILRRSGFLMLSSFLIVLVAFFLIALLTPADFRLDVIRANPDRVAASLELAPYRTVVTLADLLGFFTFATISVGFWLLGPILTNGEARRLYKLGSLLLFLSLAIWLMVTYLRVALDVASIHSPSDIPPLVGMLGLDIIAQRMVIILFSAAVGFMSWSLSRNGVLRRLGHISALLSFITTAGALASMLLGRGFPPAVVLICTYAIGIGLILKK